jgi:hypothetical protein
MAARLPSLTAQRKIFPNNSNSTVAGDVLGSHVETQGGWFGSPILSEPVD